MKLFYTIVIGVFCLIIGIGLGYSAKISMKEEKISPEKKDENISALLSAEKSPLLDDIQVRFRGEVAKIDENSLLIKKGEDSFEAKIGDSSLRIIRIAYGPEGEKKVVGEDLKLEDTKIGDQVRIRCILKEGDWQLVDIAIEELLSEPQK
jgi:hypothetical protein